MKILTTGSSLGDLGSLQEDHNYKLRLHMVTHLACEELAKEE